jgi:hypothetical protein
VIGDHVRELVKKDDELLKATLLMQSEIALYMWYLNFFKPQSVHQELKGANAYEVLMQSVPEKLQTALYYIDSSNPEIERLIKDLKLRKKTTLNSNLGINFLEGGYAAPVRRLREADKLEKVMTESTTKTKTERRVPVSAEEEATLREFELEGDEELDGGEEKPPPAKKGKGPPAKKGKKEPAKSTESKTAYVGTDEGEDEGETIMVTRVEEVTQQLLKLQKELAAEKANRGTGFDRVNRNRDYDDGEQRRRNREDESTGFPERENRMQRQPYDRFPGRGEESASFPERENRTYYRPPYDRYSDRGYNFRGRGRWSIQFMGW